MAAREDWGHARCRTAFGSRFNAHLHFHCAGIDGELESAADSVVFRAVTGLDAIATLDVQERIRQRLLQVFVRVCLLAEDAARAMGQ